MEGQVPKARRWNVIASSTWSCCTGPDKMKRPNGVASSSISLVQLLWLVSHHAFIHPSIHPSILFLLPLHPILLQEVVVGICGGSLLTDSLEANNTDVCVCCSVRRHSNLLGPPFSNMMGGLHPTGRLTSPSSRLPSSAPSIISSFRCGFPNRFSFLSRLLLLLIVLHFHGGMDGWMGGGREGGRDGRLDPPRG